MTNSRGRKLSARAVRGLLNRVAHTLDPEMSREFMGELYVLADGSAVFVERNGKGVHFFSYEELVARYRFNKQHAREHKDELAELLPDPERFRDCVPQMIAELPRLLSTRADLLDLSEESLDAVDVALGRLGRKGTLNPELFPSLTAYVGEVIRRQVNGTWVVDAPQRGGTLEPDIVDATGGRYALMRIYKELLENDRRASMRAFVHAALRMHRMLPRH